MRIAEKIRYSFFWFFDFLNGSDVKKHYNDVKFVLENYNSPKSKAKRDSYLVNILSHATKTVPFYMKISNFSSIADFPVVSKTMIRNKENFISNEYINRRSFDISTSGSTGTPFTVLQDKNKKARNTADTIYFGEKAGYKLGYKLFYIRLWGGTLKKSKLVSFLQNIKTVKSNALADEVIDNLVCEIEKGSSNKAIIGYASSLRDVCFYLNSKNSEVLNVNMKSIIANSEALGQSTRLSLKKYFGVEPISRYSNMENGILSQQILNKGSNFLINWASFYIEILDLDKDVPVNYGEIGRVVVTDLFNYHMPIIRYDTGDLAIIDVDKNNFNSVPVFYKVEGRRMDTIYNTSGKPVTYAVYDLEYFPEVKQFQLIQENHKTYLIKLSIDKIFEKEEEVRSLFQKSLGENAEINFEYVNEIPVLASGKRKLTISYLNNDTSIKKS
ncbi:phenylacetate--CoA ligase family protein [Seonamhaeicola marinus]|uniref:CoF synthetase n=1 Tax=Seonamhaeicola marinus TaxID=1912246 RepID=A0A5D0HKA7_9FLAO|nr:CoF synthetase [Seonamhaeicola marinus]TYA71823.1 CoF synthetase [Seonamhaeicola marinus]